MRVLCVCSGGNVRSVSLAYLIKQIYGYDVLTCGMRANDTETQLMLYEWANVIIVMQQEIIDKVPERFNTKVQLLDVGKDVWHIPQHPELMHKLYKGLRFLDFK